MKMAKERAALQVRIDPELHDAIAKAAEDDRRTITQLVKLILEDWAREKGYLGKPKPKR